jgi:hypothetical protein
MKVKQKVKCGPCRKIFVFQTLMYGQKCSYDQEGLPITSTSCQNFFFYFHYSAETSLPSLIVVVEVFIEFVEDFVCCPVPVECI